MTEELISAVQEQLNTISTWVERIRKDVSSIGIIDAESLNYLVKTTGNLAYYAGRLNQKILSNLSDIPHHTGEQTHLNKK